MPRLALTTILASLLLVVGLAPSSASAHSGKQSYLYVSLFDDGVTGRVEIPAADLGPALGVDFPNELNNLREAVQTARPDIAAYVAEHTRLGADGIDWTLEYGELSILPTAGGVYVVLDFVVTNEFDGAPRTFDADFSVIIESNPERDALFLIEDDWASAVFDNENEHLLGFSVGQTEQTISLEDASTLSSMAEIRGLASDEVRENIDLLLLVAASVAVIVVVPARREQRTPRGLIAVLRGASTRSGVFAAAAMIALWVVGLRIITLPTRVTAMLVVVALALVAAYLTAARLRAQLRSFDTAVFAVAGAAVGLGLGAGFVLQDLDRSRPVTGLVAFALGALIAAFLIAMFVALPLLLVRRTRYIVAITLAMSVIFIGYAAVWAGELIANDDWPIEQFANPLRVWPRNFWFVLLAIAAAAGLRAIEQRAGRLQPIAVPPPTPSAPADATREPVST